MHFVYSQGRNVQPKCRGLDEWAPQCAASNVILPPYHTTSMLRPSPSPTKFRGNKSRWEKRLLQDGRTANRLAARAAAAASSFPSSQPESLSVQLQQTLDVAKWLSSKATTDETSKAASIDGSSCSRATALAQAFAMQLSTEGRAALLAALYPAGEPCLNTLRCRVVNSRAHI